MSLLERSLMCVSGHQFDLAKHGYVSLLAGGSRANTGDTADMVAARVRFLSLGLYAPIADAITAMIPNTTGLCVDVAGGTGYYLNSVLRARSGITGINLDLSKFALRRAARIHDRLAAVGADVWQRLPIQSDSCLCVLSIFGPKNATEMARVLDPEGRLIVVTPTTTHMRELVEPLELITVDPHKDDRLRTKLAPLTPVNSQRVEYEVAMSEQNIMDEVLMGPTAYHVKPDDLTKRIERLKNGTTVTVSATIWQFATTA